MLVVIKILFCKPVQCKRYNFLGMPIMSRILAFDLTLLATGGNFLPVGPENDTVSEHTCLTSATLLSEG